MFQQPLDTCPSFTKLLDAVGGTGNRFSVTETEALLRVNRHKAIRVLRDLREALAGCPEGVQLTVKRGPGGGYCFHDGFAA